MTAPIDGLAPADLAADDPTGETRAKTTETRPDSVVPFRPAVMRRAPAGEAAAELPSAQAATDVPPPVPPVHGNAARVARHRAKLAAQGLKQINVQVPVSVHPVVKRMARRLRDGEDLTVVLFDLVAEVTAADPGPDGVQGALPACALRPDGARTDRGLSSALPPLAPPDLTNPPVGAPTRPGEEDELVRRVRQTLRHGGWRAKALRRLVE